MRQIARAGNSFYDTKRNSNDCKCSFRVRHLSDLHFQSPGAVKTNEMRLQLSRKMFDSDVQLMHRYR